MIRYIGKRLIMMVPVILAVTFLIFFLQYLAPGDPAELQLGVDASEEEKEAWREEFNLNDPLLVQYGKYLCGIVTRGDFGKSFRTGQVVTKDLFERWPTTFVLAILTQVVAASIGVLAGVFAALNRSTWKDGVIRVLAMIGAAMPSLWFALLLILKFAVDLKWFPVSGWYGPKYWVLPAISTGVLGAAGYMRNVRAAVLDNVKQDFVRTARAKGQKESKVVLHHIMGNALIPIITCAGLHFAMALGGTMIIEQIFAIPGLGRYMVEAINNRDFPQLRAAIILTAVTVSVVNLIIDILYAAVDPRIKAGFKGASAKKRKITAADLAKEGN